MGFVFMAGTWFFLSLYLRLVFPVLLFITVLISTRSAKNLPFFVKTTTVSKMKMSLTVAVLLVVILLDVLVIQGYFYSDEAVDMSFPLRNGKYCVIQGGNSRVTNFFHRFGESEKYALDIAKLNGFGNRAKGLTPKKLLDYEIFGDAIFSPCDGTVIEVVDGLPDNVPHKFDIENPTGNHVIISCQEIRVLLAHMMRESVLVKEGDAVISGQGIGKVGNSGNTTEPHLHISAVDNNDIGVLIAFHGKFLSLNSIFSNDVPTQTTTMN
ncbi:MAG: M23 family metallopeptidase [bacterium]